MDPPNPATWVSAEVRAAPSAGEGVEAKLAQIKLQSPHLGLRLRTQDVKRHIRGQRISNSQVFGRVSAVTPGGELGLSG